MIQRRIRVQAALAILSAGATLVFAAGLPKAAQPLREVFENRMTQIDKENERRLMEIGLAYEDKLRQIEYEMQIAGRLRELVAVYDERARFSKTQAPAPIVPGTEPVELKGAQEALQKLYQYAQYSNEISIVRLTGQYLQAMAGARKDAAEAGDDAGLKAIDEERDRVIALARIRKALKGSLVDPATNLAAAAVAAAMGTAISSDITDQRTERDLRMYRLSTESPVAVMGYSIGVTLVEDRSKVRGSKTEGKKTYSESFSGPIGFQPRVTVACRNGEVPPGSRIIIEYFSRSVVDGVRKYVSTEAMTLPGIAKGEQQEFEFKGIWLTRTEGLSATVRVGSSKTYSGDEFHGLIVSLVDGDGRVLVQRFNPQSLDREVSTTPGQRQ